MRLFDIMFLSGFCGVTFCGVRLANMHTEMRNALAPHGYFKVDLEIVWKTIHNDLPGLYQKVQQKVQQRLEDLPCEDNDDSWGMQP